MSQDLDQIVLLIGAILGGVFGLLFLLAALEPGKPDVAEAAPRPSLWSQARLLLARRVLGARPVPASGAVDAG